MHRRRVWIYFLKALMASMQNTNHKSFTNRSSEDLQFCDHDGYVEYRVFDSGMDYRLTARSSSPSRYGHPVWLFRAPGLIGMDLFFIVSSACEAAMKCYL